MVGLITDRTQANVDRLKVLSAKGWSKMTAAERAEWSGDPMITPGANLLPRGENYGSGTTVKFQGKDTIVTSSWDGSYIYAVLSVGPAAQFTGKTMTLSLDAVESSGGAANVALYWHDANGSEYAGGGLGEAGSITFTLTANTNNRQTLAVYLYATTTTAISAGDFIRYSGLMLEIGSTRHDYMPYYAVLPTPATKGAYTYADLNRVESAVKELAAKGGLALVTKTDWRVWDIPKKADMDRYLGNLVALRQAYPLPPDIPPLPTSMAKLTYAGANDIEKTIGALAEAIELVFRSGELYSGEV